MKNFIKDFKINKSGIPVLPFSHLRVVKSPNFEHFYTVYKNKRYGGDGKNYKVICCWIIQDYDGVFNIDYFLNNTTATEEYSKNKLINIIKES